MQKKKNGIFLCLLKLNQSVSVSPSLLLSLSLFHCLERVKHSLQRCIGVEYSIYRLSSNSSVFSPIFCYLCRPGPSWVLSPPSFWGVSAQSPQLQHPPWVLLSRVSSSPPHSKLTLLPTLVSRNLLKPLINWCPLFIFCEFITLPFTVIFRGWRERS